MIQIEAVDRHSQKWRIALSSKHAFDLLGVTGIISIFLGLVLIAFGVIFYWQPSGIEMQGLMAQSAGELPIDSGGAPVTIPQAASLINRLVDEIPVDRLKSLVLELMIATPAAGAEEPGSATAVRRRRRKAKPKPKAEPKGQSAKQRYIARRSARRGAARAEKAAAKAASPAHAKTPPRPRGRGGRRRKAAEPSSNGHSNAGVPAVSAEALWKQASRLAPTKPWTVVASEFGLNAAVALDAYRGKQLPPNLNQIAAARFLEMRPG
jgi:hypothetical protein